jgi:hypothetical protein
MTTLPGYQRAAVGVGDPRVEALYKGLERTLPPPVPDGPEPTSDHSWILPHVTSPGVPMRMYSTLVQPRKRVDRSIGDEMALLIAQYNEQHKSKLPVDGNDPWWTKQGGDTWLLQNMFGRIATGRYNAYQCAAGKGHCHEPGVFETIGNAISKIPVVGDIVHIVGEAAAAPFNLASNIASGARLDHALVGALKDQVKIVKDVAPYVQMVVSFVPGIGTGVAAAIGAGTALVEGKSIDEALKAGIKGALPGGPLAAAAFDMAMKAASGENVGKAALESARNLVPDGPARKAFDVGLAVATGEKLQNALVKGLVSIAPGQLQTIIAAGEKAVASTPGLADALKLVPVGEAQKGFQMAAGLLGQANMNEKALAAVRNQLPAAVRQGFDTALNSQVKHIPWIENVIHAPAAAPAPTQAQLDLQALSKLTPEQQKQLVDMNAPAAPKAVVTPKPHEPPAKKPTVPAPAVVTRPTAPAAPATPLTAAQAAPAPGAPVTTPYGPYPPKGGALHGAPRYGAYSTPLGALSGPPPSCRALGAPINVMDPGMRRAGLSAVHGSGGRPRMVHSPDGVDYLFTIENGALTARQCFS